MCVISGSFLTWVSTGKLAPYWETLGRKLVLKKVNFNLIIGVVWSDECSSSALSSFIELVNNSKALSISVNVINTLKHQLIPIKYYSTPALHSTFYSFMIIIKTNIIHLIKHDKMLLICVAAAVIIV